MQGSGTLTRRHRLTRAAALVILIASVGGIAWMVAAWEANRRPGDAGIVPTMLQGTEKAWRLETTPAALPVPVAPTVATHPARLDEFAPAAPLRPVRLTVDAGGVIAEVVPVGVDESGVAMDLPPDASMVAWYEHGPSPGDAGSAVVAGHVDFGGRRGAFYGLAHVEPGATITVEFEDSSARAFSVTARRTYAKAELPVDELFRHDGPATLVLVTCGGAYDRATRSYADNVVLYAVPI